MGLFDPIDWNRNGKRDTFDRMTDFFIFNELNKENKKRNDDLDFYENESDDEFSDFSEDDSLF